MSPPAPYVRPRPVDPRPVGDHSSPSWRHRVYKVTACESTSFGDKLNNAATIRLAPWRSGIAPENIGGVYGHNAVGSNPSAQPPGVKGKRVAGGELRHLTGLPGGGGDMWGSVIL
jgi:hypothetical protein